MFARARELFGLVFACARCCVGLCLHVCAGYACLCVRVRAPNVDLRLHVVGVCARLCLHVLAGNVGVCSHVRAG